MKIDDSYLARRRFLCGMLGGGAVALGASVGVPLVGYVGNLREDPPPKSMEIEKAVYQLAAGTSRKLMYGPITALLIQTPGPESILKVFVATCTHLDCPVGYDRKRNRIFCPCHEGYYHVDGRVMSGPPPRPLQEFHRRFREGKLIIALQEENLLEENLEKENLEKAS